MSQQFEATPKAMGDKTAASVPPNLQEAFARVVTAGMRVMFSKETHDLMLQEINKEGDLADNVGQAMAGLMLLLYQKSNKTMPTPIIIPAATYLLMQGADFLEKVTHEKMTPDIISKAMQVMMDTLMQKFGIQPDKFHAAMQKAAQGGYNQ